MSVRKKNKELYEQILYEFYRKNTEVLGIQFEKENIQLHRKIASWKFEKTKAFILNSEQILLRILEANNQRNIYPTKVDEQLALFKKVAKMLPQNADIWVVGDTEFQSVRLLRWFSRRHWHFVIRQQGKNKVRWKGQPWIKINALNLSKGQTRVIGWVRLTRKHDNGWYWLVLHWDTAEDEPWYLISDQSGKSALLRIYRKRMWIEEMFGDMKGHGFDLEATHLKDANRISRFFLGISIVFVWLITLGSWVVKRGFRHFVDHKSRRDKSYFRIGWDWVERRLSLQHNFSFHFRPYF